MQLVSSKHVRNSTGVNLVVYSVIFCVNNETSIPAAVNFLQSFKIPAKFPNRLKLLTAKVLLTKEYFPHFNIKKNNGMTSTPKICQ